ncbi:MAG: phosphocholine cytidylyltransferase family protein [Candidatus Hodarchaeales archaeon]
MVFIKKVVSGSKTYYYLVRSYRVKDSVQQEIIKRLTPEEAKNPTYIARYLQNNPIQQKNDIKAVILAAGKSLRLYPYSQDLPKALIPIGDKPIIHHIIDFLRQGGVSDISVVTGFQDQKMQELLERDVKSIFNPFYTVSNILASLWSASQVMDSSLIILYGDILFNPEIVNELIQDQNSISVAITSSNLDNDSEKVIVRDGFVLDIGKNLPIDSKSIFEFAGIMKFDQQGTEILFDTIKEMSHEEGFLDMQLPALFQRLILKGYGISTVDISPNLWIDIDFPKDIHRAEKTILPNIKSRTG